MGKKNKLVKIKDPDCLNCGYPFSGYEIFCPECGQKNKGDQLTFVSFLKEVFNGFISWDAKFWKTILPLLFKPGKVSKDYIEGKRQRYSNPFRFYLTVSILFFLIVGLTENYAEFNKLRKGENIEEIENKGFFNGIKYGWNKAETNTDSTHINNNEGRTTSIKPIQNDTASVKKKGLFLNVAGENVEINKLMKFQKNHPNLNTDTALDSLKMHKNLWNRFWYSRASVINKISDNTGEEINKINKLAYSYMPIALFIMLPIFTLFLKLFYIRRKYTYVENLVFVFHVQTVFFLLLIFFYIISIFNKTEYFTPIFLLIFLIYLFIAMKKFYSQGYFKTFIKFILANAIYSFLGIIGIVIIALLTFAVY